jgi:ADP-ribose pyrophosphatase
MSKVSTNWKTVNTKVIFKNKYYEFREDEVLRHDGGTSFYYYRHSAPFSIVIPIINSKTILVRQYRYNVKSLSWEFPMGFAEGKNPYDTAITELKEETGMTCKKLEEIGHYWVSNGNSDQSAYIFVAKDLTKGDSEPEEGEFLEQKEFEIDQVGKMIERGEILDGPTIVAYHYLEKYLKK